MSLLGDIASSVSALRALERPPQYTTLDLAGTKAFPVSGRFGSVDYMLPRLDVTVSRPSEVDYAEFDAMASSVVMACVNRVMACFPEGRLAVYRWDAEGQKEEVQDHELPALFYSDRATIESDAMQQSVVCDYMVPGDAYLWKLRDRRGRAAELLPLPARLVRAVWPRAGSRWLDRYELWTPAGWQPLRVEDVVHVKNGIDWRPGSDGRYGLSPLASVMRDVYADEEGGEYAAALLRNMGVVGAVLSPKEPVTMTKEDKAAFVAAYQEAYTGANRGRPMVFQVPLDVRKIAPDPKSMSLDALHRKAEARISGLLGVPAICAGLQVGLERSTFNNTDQAWEQLWESCVIPMQRAVARSLTRSLLPEFEGSDGMFCAFDNSDVRALQEDETEARERDRTDFLSGRLTYFQSCARMGVEPPKGAQDFILIPNTVTPVPLSSLPMVPAPAALPPAPANGNGAAKLARKAADPDPDDEPDPDAKDVEETARRVRKDPAWLGDLADFVDADEKGEPAAEAKAHAYDLATRDYRDRAGRVSTKRLREAVADFNRRTADKMQDIMRGLAAGDLSGAEAEIALRQFTKDAYLTNAAAARGGWARVAPEDLSRAGGYLREQYAYLRRRVAGVESGEVKAEDAVRTVRGYAEGAKRMFEQTFQREQSAAEGVVEGRRVLHAEESCDDCVRLARVPWGPLAEVQPVGVGTECGGKCRCEIVVRKRRAQEGGE